MKELIHQYGAAPRALLADLRRDFAPWPGWNLRVADEIACLAAVLLAIVCSRLLGIGNPGWAAFSAYMVIRTSFFDSLERGILRIFGTAAGVSLACLLAPQLVRATALMSLALALVGTITVYRALLDRRGYGWLIAGLSFAMVLIDAMEHAHQAASGFAQARFTEVGIGSCAAMVVSAIAALTLPRQLLAPAPATVPHTPAARSCRKAALWHALQAAIALALIPWIWSGFHLEALSQSSITIMTVMIVPIADLAAPARPTSTRTRHRLLGCSIGGLLASAILLASHAAPLIIALSVCFGVLAGRHIENGKLNINYAGTQLALAFLVVLIPDGHAGPDAAAGAERLIGIFVGMALLEPVRLLFRWLARPA